MFGKDAVRKKHRYFKMRKRSPLICNEDEKARLIITFAVVLMHAVISNKNGQ